MKNYFNFQLNGKKLLPYWLAGYVFIIFIIVYAVRLVLSTGMEHQKFSIIFPFLLFILIFIFLCVILYFYVLKIIISAIEYKGEKVKCDFRLSHYLTKVIIPGILLSIITIGIYIPWFTRNLYRYFINNSSYKDKNFSFLGEGGNLFVIIVLSCLIPIIIFSIIVNIIFGIHVTQTLGLTNYQIHPTQASGHNIFIQIIQNFILIPFYYLFYKWRVNLKYNNLHFTWHTEFFPSVAKILKEFFFGIITLLIYMPMAYLKLYKYFVSKTKSNIMDNQQYCFGFDKDKDDFLFLWGYIALCIVTLGIYYPWAFCKIANRILSRTYIEKQIVNPI